MDPVINNNNSRVVQEIDGEIEESWNDLSSPDLTTETITQDQQLQPHSTIRSRLSNNTNEEGGINNTSIESIESINTPSIQQQQQQQQLHQLHPQEQPKWQKCTIKILILIGYTITTILFSIITYLHYFFIRYSYDEETAINILDGVFRAQEKSINDYHKRHQHDNQNNSHRNSLNNNIENIINDNDQPLELNDGINPPSYQ
ncbi:uncharacterized protein KGF55_004593 [Candida pseudojiufengensis]|uniref:uncharacterized protein n=1 Tax=Candida pseudojiufengensis TaxID=497109 RepID=UPI002225AC8F|nr:uncharacterized protein KGF55_004593 [Candida pseudojiufengensis]KAI5960301.1 hypothetical protein KGF55_004593 [Candida pseudojiufengensis]